MPATFQETLFRRENISPLVYLVLALAAIPVLDMADVVQFADIDTWGRCVPRYPGGIDGLLRQFVEFGTAALIVFANIGLYNYLVVISGTKDDQHPNGQQVAVLISFMIFASLIFFYATLYFVELPCMHFIYRDRHGWYRVVSDFVQSSYFSTITITTLGYGDFSPKNYLAGETVSALEAVNGLTTFGMFTGALAGFIAKNK